MVLGATYPLQFVLSAVDRVSGPLTRVQNRLGRMGASMTRLGRGMTLGVSAPLAAAGVGAIRASMDFETSMLRVGALSRTVGTPAFEGLRDKAKELGATTQFSASQAAGAMGFLAQSGQVANEILASLPPTLNLSAASMMDLAQTADVSVAILKGYGKQATEMGLVSDVMTAAINTSNNDLTQLSEGMKLAGPVAAGMNIRFQETVATLAAMGDGGFRATLGGTALRGMISKLANATPEAQRELGKLGISRDDLLDDEGNLKSLVGTIELLEQKGATAGQVLRIFGERAGPAVNALLGEEIGSAGIRRIMGELDNSGGAAERFAEIMQSGAKGGLDSFLSAVEGLAIEVGESGLLPWFGSAIRKGAEWVRSLSGTGKSVLKWGTIVAAGAAAAGPLIFGLGQTLLLTKGLAGGIKFTFAALSAGGPVFRLVTGLGGGLLRVVTALGIGLVRGLVPAVWSLTAAMAANPIGATVLAVGALSAGFAIAWKRSERFREIVTGAFQGLRAGVGIALDWLLDKLSALADWLVPDWILDLLGVGGGGAAPAAQRIGARSIAQTTSGAALASPSPGGEARVRVDFENVPPGVQVSRETRGDIDMDLGLGLAMVAPS